MVLTNQNIKQETEELLTKEYDSVKLMEQVSLEMPIIPKDGFGIEHHSGANSKIHYVDAGGNEGGNEWCGILTKKLS